MKETWRWFGESDPITLQHVRQTGASDDTAKEVKIFGLSGFLIGRFRELSE